MAGPSPEVIVGATAQALAQAVISTNEVRRNLIIVQVSSLKVQGGDYSLGENYKISRFARNGGFLATLEMTDGGWSKLQGVGWKLLRARE